MSDWGEAAIIDAFPRDKMTYFIQFIVEPKLKKCVSQDGRKYEQLAIKVQHFALSEQTGEYAYIGWGEKRVHPCVFEGLTAYGHLIETSMFEVRGFKHKQHVDLEVIETYPRQSASESIDRDAQSGPIKGTASELPRLGEQQQRGVQATPTSGSVHGQAGAGADLGESPETTIMSGLKPKAPAKIPLVPCHMCGNNHALDVLCAQPPAEPCIHPDGSIVLRDGEDGGFYCKTCGERVG